MHSYFCTASMPAAAAVHEAAVRIRGRVLRTPVLRSDWVDARLAPGTTAYFKAEHLQRTGSFKLRGAVNAVFALSDEAARRGVAAHSSGNHAAAVACAAAARSIPCTIVVPEGTPQAKQDNARAYGAEVVLCAPTQRARRETALAVAERMGGAALIHPYDDPLVIAGQGTLALELLSQCAEGLDAIIVPVSGGGMATGIALAAAARGVRVYAAEPAGKRLADSLAAGERIIDPTTADAPLPTIADAIRSQPLGPTPWSLRDLLQPAVLSVTDDQIRAAMRDTAAHMGQVVEPAGAVATAALLSPAFREEQRRAQAAGRPLRRVAAIVCGGNIELAEWARMVGLGS